MLWLNRTDLCCADTAMRHGPQGSWDHHWIWWAAPLVGATLGSCTWFVLQMPAINPDNKSEQSEGTANTMVNNPMVEETDADKAGSED